MTPATLPGFCCTLAQQNPQNKSLMQNGCCGVWGGAPAQCSPVSVSDWFLRRNPAPCEDCLLLFTSLHPLKGNLWCMPNAAEGRVYLQRVSLGSFTCAVFGHRQWQYGEHCGAQWVPRSACCEGMDKTVLFQFNMLQLGSRRYWARLFIFTFTFSATSGDLFPSFLIG